MRLDKVATPLKLLIPFYFFTFIPCASVCVRACVPAGVCVCYSVFICSNWKKIQIQIVNFLKFFSNRSHVKWMQPQANQWKINQTTNVYETRLFVAGSPEYTFYFGTTRNLFVCQPIPKIQIKFGDNWMKNENHKNSSFEQKYWFQHGFFFYSLWNSNPNW